ncbi:MAG: menaquinone biosynthesis family protein [Chlamydiales bacterium]|nr:menaquinone biosynthesis family protein [Chlamydiales bacterium]
MKIAISPCPNDTYLFHAWITGLVGEPPETTFADIQYLNELAHKGRYPLIKISFNCLREVSETYQLLPVGSALGFHCGPKIIAKRSFSLEKLPEKRIAVPGKETTAHLLLEKLLPEPMEKQFCLYNEIPRLIDDDIVDCGLIIHETRFTYLSLGFFEIADLGELWHERFQLPLPLGCLAIHRDYPDKEGVVRLLQDSLAYARAHPLASRSFILEHSQEREYAAVERHIDTYVNEETENLSERGLEAIQTLLEICPKNLLYSPKEVKQKQPCTP